MIYLKIRKTLGLLRKLQNLLPRSALITVCKAFVRPYLDYGDILYDQAYNMSFHLKLESIQYNACLAITGAMRDTSKEKLYQELGLETLQLQRWNSKIEMFYKIFKNKSPQYLFKLIPEKTHAYATRNVGNIPCFIIRHNFFKNSFFPSAVSDWNNLDPTLIRPSPNNVFDCNKYKGIRYITRLRVGKAHLREHKFKHSFQYWLNPICSCGLDIESTSHFLLHCPTFNDERYTLLSTLNKIDCKLLESTKSSLSQTMFYGNTLFDKEEKTLILNATIEYILPRKDSRSLLLQVIK